MKPNIKLSLSKLTPVYLLTLLYTVIKSLTGNAFFANPAVKLVDMQVLADKLKVAIEDAINGGKNERQIRDQLVVETQDMLRVQADYVRTASAGDAVKLGSSGFQMAAIPQPFETMDPPSNVRTMATGKVGQVVIRFKSSRGAHSYQILMSETDPGTNPAWKPVGVTSRVRYTMNGLASYKPVWFAVVTIGAKADSALSAPAMGRAA